MKPPPPKFYLECGECGESVFERDQDAYGDGEECTCPGCGSLCVVSIDDVEEPAVAWCNTIVDAKGDDHG